MSQKRRKFDRAASSAGGAHLVGGDALYPGLQAGFGAESWQVLPGFGEGVLDGVLGVVGVAVEHGGGVAEHSRPVAADDVREGAPITQGRSSPETPTKIHRHPTERLTSPHRQPATRKPANDPQATSPTPPGTFDPRRQSNLTWPGVRADRATMPASARR